MELNEQQRTYLENTHAAAMITLHRDGTPAAVRCGTALVDGKIWASGTQDRARTQHMRRDSRATLFVFETAGFRYLTLESKVTVLEGPDVPEQSVRLFRAMQHRPIGPLMWNGVETREEDFRRTMAAERRLIYEFEPLRVYGGI